MIITPQRPNVMITSTGVFIDPLEVNITEINILDIAKSLSKLCRWNGHCNRFYSVAEHSVHVSSLCSEEHKLAGLLHDATEAYLSDVPTPLKKRMPFYMEAEDKLSFVIADRFGFQYPYSEEVKRYDYELLEIEAVNLTMYEVLPVPLQKVKLLYLNPEDAEKLFLEKFNELIGDN